MLSKWNTTNFKSYKDLALGQLAKVNVLAGANSSGKSTVIQSILLLKQSVQYGSIDRPLTLNGPLLRMGAFSDIRSFLADDDGVSFDFSIDLSGKDFQATRNAAWYRRLNRNNFSSNENEIIKISLKFTLAETTQSFLDKPGPVSSSSTPDLPNVRLMVTRKLSKDVINEAFIDLRSVKDEERNDRFSFFDYAVRLDSQSEKEVMGDLPRASISGGFVRRFLPGVVAVKYDEAIQEKKRLVDSLFDSHFLGHFPSSLYSNEILPREAAELINNWVLENGGDGFRISEEGVSVADIFSSLEPVTRRLQANSLGLFGKSIGAKEVLSSETSVDELKASLLNSLTDSVDEKIKFAARTANDLERAGDFLVEFFSDAVRYLGPLRDSPRPVYQPEALASETDVGYRGEHTAAVLDLNKQRPVLYRRPPKQDFDYDYVQEAQEAKSTLHDAVVEWLEYLGVAEEVVTTDAGVYGNRLQVSTDGQGQLHDLTNVGVGVSQVLPIVVMALLAEPGSLLIFEQPELHLHPKVQARLADLFLALALDDKQLFLETHSEYLIDRFRLRIAMSENDSVRPLVNILFSEKVSGESQLNKIELNEFGAIVNWPADFFEQSQKDVSKILRATARRRKSQK